jgi:hypothetical protein
MMLSAVGPMAEHEARQAQDAWNRGDTRPVMLLALRHGNYRFARLAEANEPDVTVYDQLLRRKRGGKKGRPSKHSGEELTARPPPRRR